MKTPLRTVVAAAAIAGTIAGAGLAGLGLTSAVAQTDQGDNTITTTTEAPSDPGGRPEGCRGGGPGIDTMAEAVGIGVEEFRTALENGQSPAEVAEANGVSRADLVDAIVADITEHLEQGVEDGRLTQEEADERLADVEEHAQAIVDGERPDGMGPGGPGRPPFGHGEAPAGARPEDTNTDA
jgi:hypothetical protein